MKMNSFSLHCILSFSPLNLYLKFMAFLIPWKEMIYIITHYLTSPKP